jgi:hypothetical protein
MGQTLALTIVLITGLVAAVAAFFGGWYAHKVHITTGKEKTKSLKS